MGWKGRSGGRLLLISAGLPLIAAVLWHSNARAEDVPSRTVIKSVPFDYVPPEAFVSSNPEDDLPVTITIDDETVYDSTAGALMDDPPDLTAERTGVQAVVLQAGGSSYVTRVRSIDGILSILPPLVAILFALMFRQVVVALLAGVWLGSLILTGWQPLSSLMRIVDYYAVEVLSGEEGADHISIVIFTLLLGGMVGITSRMGGMQGIVDRISRLATSPRRGQLTVWLMGVVIFFDDYTNTLIVGNSTRPLTDRLRISREKLSYIVDSTAAPVTALAVITSWIGFQISLIDQSFVSLGIDRNPLATFVSAIPYGFYPVLAIYFVLLVILTGRDFSLMLRAEKRARSTGMLSSPGAMPMSELDTDSISPAEGVRPAFINGILPIATVIGVTFAGLLITGRASLAGSGAAHFGVFEMIRESDSFKALLWGSFSGCIVAAVLALSRRQLGLMDTMGAFVGGIRSMMAAMIILVLAWSIGEVCTETGTADYLVHHLSGILTPVYLPLLVFLLAMGISFSTGTSWGTMSILTPIVIPLVYGTALSAGMDAGAAEPVLLSSIAAILSGAVFGDHCSPISDTTIMSSMASGADHVDHVRTQLPYALTVGAVAMVAGYLLSAWGVPVPLCLLAGALALYGIIRVAGSSSGPDGSPA